MLITKPILATDFDESKLVYPIIATPKIDGVRGIHLYGRPAFTGRSLKPFGNSLVSNVFTNLEGIDGELTYGPITASDVCRTTTSVVNTHDDTRANSLILNAFDYITPTTVKLGYLERYAALQEFLAYINRQNIHLVPYTTIHSLDELLSYESSILAQGYEGVILRSPNGLYKNGRTTVKEGTYLRIKRFIQEDAVVLSLTEAMENANEAVTNALGRTERSTHQSNLIPKGMLGSLVCRDIKSGAEITVGSGELSHELRTYYWNNPDQLVGRTISYKFFPKGVKDKPRFPTFVAVRPEEDLVSE